MSSYNDNYWDKRYEWRQEEYQRQELPEDNEYWDRPIIINKETETSRDQLSRTET